jgi:hypothetical protein
MRQQQLVKHRQRRRTVADRPDWGVGQRDTSRHHHLHDVDDVFLHAGRRCCDGHEPFQLRRLVGWRAGVLRRRGVIGRRQQLRRR